MADKKKEVADYKQREIKFRVVWNGRVSLDSYSIGEFIEGVELEFKDGGSLPMTDIDRSEDTVKYIQRTGLKDKNGEAVYEGDILSCDYFDDGVSPHTFVVEWIGLDLCGGATGYIPYSGGSAYFAHGKEEVIGNIFENPELIK